MGCTEFHVAIVGTSKREGGAAEGRNQQTGRDDRTEPGEDEDRHGQNDAGNPTTYGNHSN